MAVMTIETPDQTTTLQHQTQATSLLSVVTALTITDDASLETAGEYARTIARGKSTIAEFFRPMKKAADEAHKTICRQETGLLALWKKADDLLRGKMSAFQALRQREAADRARRDAEERRKVAEEALLQSAIQLENLAAATGDAHYRQAAAQVLDQPVRVAVEAEKPKGPDGTSFVTEVSVLCDDFPKFLRAVAAGSLVLDEKTLGRLRDAVEPWVRREAEQRGAAFEIPGWVRTEGIGVRVRK